MSAPSSRSPSPKPVLPPSSAEETGRPDHPDNWRNGIGDGAHSPYYCQPFMRFLCEGEAEEAHRAYLRRLIILGRSRR